MRVSHSIFGRHSLFWKIYLSMIFVLFMPVVLFSLHRLVTEQREGGLRVHDELLRNLGWEAAQLAEEADSLGDELLQDWIGRIQKESALELRIARGGQSFWLSDMRWAGLPTEDLPTPPRGPLTANARSNSGETEATVFFTLPMPPPPGNRTIRDVGFLAMAGIGLIFAFLIVRNFTHPITELRKVTAKLAAGDFSVRAGKSVLAHGSEIADLGVSFNWMAECVENVINSQKRLLIDISHELRSPLQRMDVALTLARKNPASEREQYLDRVELEIERINEMVDELLTLTRAETMNKAPEPVRLDEILQSVADDAEFEGQLQDKKILTRIERITVLGDASLLKRAFGNVVYNAIRYTPAESNVEIENGKMPDGMETVVTIRDHGQGVAEEELENIFQPYYRTDAARERPHGGTGLGLSITKRVIEGHGGRVSAANAPHGGLVVTIILPLPHSIDPS